MSGKKMKLSHDKSSNLHGDDCTHNHLNVSNNAANSWLCKLPIELLEFIFSFLSTQDIVNIQKLDVQRLTEASHKVNVETADFVLCNTVSPVDVTLFFNRDRVQHIREINFNNLFLVKASMLQNCIVKCKHLKKLSVLDCNLPYLRFLFILRNCIELEEVFWNVPTKVLSGHEYPSISSHGNVKKLYLRVDTLDDKCLYLISDLIVRCISAKDICLFFIRQFTELLPPAGHLISVYKTNRVEGRTMKLVLKDHSFNIRFTDKGALRPYEIVTMMTKPLAIYSQLRQYTESSAWLFNACQMGFVCFPFPNQSLAYLQVKVYDERLSLPQLPDNSVHSLVLLFQERESMNSVAEIANPPQMFNQMDGIIKMIGSNLRSLTFNNGGFYSQKSDILNLITMKCHKIKILNLSSLHCSDIFDFSALYCLEDLEELILASCTFSDYNFNQNVYNCPFFNQASCFKKVVASCRKVEKFSLYSCRYCPFEPNEKQIVPIHEWKKLRSLILSGIKYLRSCHFLRQIASCCQLASLELINVGDPSVCYYIPNLVHAIENLTQLKFLRINQKAFPPANRSFWKSIESARNLQGICLRTSTNTCINNELVTESLKKLPFLHLFHLSARRFCHGLSKQMKQIMTQNGIEIRNVDICCIDEDTQDECQLCQLYII